MRISDWSSDVCSSDLDPCGSVHVAVGTVLPDIDLVGRAGGVALGVERNLVQHGLELAGMHRLLDGGGLERLGRGRRLGPDLDRSIRSEEHTSELQSLMRISYAVFCLKNKNKKHKYQTSKHQGYQIYDSEAHTLTVLYQHLHYDHVV